MQNIVIKFTTLHMHSKMQHSRIRWLWSRMSKEAVAMSLVVAHTTGYHCGVPIVHAFTMHTCTVNSEYIYSAQSQIHHVQYIPVHGQCIIIILIHNQCMHTLIPLHVQRIHITLYYWQQNLRVHCMRVLIHVHKQCINVQRRYSYTSTCTCLMHACTVDTCTECKYSRQNALLVHAHVQCMHVQWMHALNVILTTECIICKLT